MTIKLKTPTAETRKTAATLFDALSAMRVAPMSDEGKEGRVPFSRLYAYATSPVTTEDPAIEGWLARDALGREGYRRLLEKTATYRLPRVAAASSGALLQREGAGCRIRFERSRAEPSQTYVIIEIAEAEAPAPTSVFVCDPESRCRRYPLPPPREGVVQLLLEEDSELLARLLDVKTQVFVR